MKCPTEQPEPNTNMDNNNKTKKINELTLDIKIKSNTLRKTWRH